MSKAVEKAITHQKDLVKKAEEWFDGFASQTKDITYEILREICWRKEELECSWDVALRDLQVLDKLYQLLMHRQYVAYLAEDLRQKTSRLLMLQGELRDFLSDKSKYTELVEKKAGSRYMKKIFEEFISQVKPELEKMDAHDS